MRSWIFGDDVNTDVIIPGRFNITTDEKELAKNAFCEVRPDFSKEVMKGDIVVAGRNFGCGSSREHAAIALKGTGISCIIARSYARIFFRNAINIGLPVLECDELHGNCDDGDELDVDISKGIIKNLTKEKEFKAVPLPGFVIRIVESGGIVNFLKNHDIEELLR
jgi:3-isopropylmalate/(R)-2-methylmalate dehydratase small subunit